MENKIILDGVEYNLSEELAEMLKAEVVEQKAQRDLKSPFEREDSDTFYFITTCGHVNYDTDDMLRADDEKYNVGNYCRDRATMEQRALHETLDRLLWRYSETHGGENVWNSQNLQSHYYIYLDTINSVLYVSYNDAHRVEGVVYFKDEDTAEAAIEEVVKPFMSEHPEFVW